jgi:hypothetical protein
MGVVTIPTQERRQNHLLKRELQVQHPLKESCPPPRCQSGGENPGPCSVLLCVQDPPYLRSRRRNSGVRGMNGPDPPRWLSGRTKASSPARPRYMQGSQTDGVCPVLDGPAVRRRRSPSKTFSFWYELGKIATIPHEPFQEIKFYVIYNGDENSVGGEQTLRKG